MTNHNMLYPGAREAALGPWLASQCWLARRLARDPITWVLALAVGTLWVLRRTLAPIGITATEGEAPGPLYDVAFMAVPVALALAAWVLGRSAWIWAPLEAAQRSLAEWTFLCLVGAAGFAPIATQGFTLYSSPGGAPELTGLIALWLHGSALALLLTRLPLSPAVAPLLLLTALWWLPALFPSEPGPLGHLVRLLAGPLGPQGAVGAGGPTGAAAQSAFQTQTTTPVDMAPALAFGLAAWLLTPRNPRP